MPSSAPMKTIPPKSRVPPDWIHPALHRQWQRRDKLRTPHELRLEELDVQRTEMEEASRRIMSIVSEKKSALEKLDRQREKAKADIDLDEAAAGEITGVLDRLTSQITVHKTLPRCDARLLDTSDSENFASGAAHCVLSVECGSTWGAVASCFPCDNEIKRSFFSQYAPLFNVTSDDSSAAQKVGGAAFFDEGCLLSVDQVSCFNPACPYWHKEQLTHLKLTARKLVSRAANFIRGNRNNCDVAALFHRFRMSMEASTALHDAVRIERDMMNCIATLGWAAIFLQKDEVAENKQGRYRPPPSRITWDAPIQSKPHMPLMQKLYSLLRNPQECSAWESLIGSSPSTLIADAVSLFQRHVDVLSWRCLMRVAGDTPERLLWLASRGIEIFPTSPSIRLSHLYALLHSGNTASECVDVCLESVRILSVQASKCTLSSSGKVEWSESVARYIAYMIAMTCVRVAPMDAQAAMRLLTYAVKVPGRVCLLPLAQQNLTLMLIAICQTGKLEGMNDLPLASISDVTFALSEHFPGRPQDACAGLLSRQLNMNAGCAAAGIDAELMDRMQSAVHLSLMRAFSSNAVLVERILTKVKMGSVTAMAELWCDYLRVVRQHDGTEALVSLIRSLLEECKSPLLILHFVKILDFNAEDTTAVASSAVQRFAEENGITVENIASLASSETVTFPVSDWVPFILLHARSLAPQRRVELIFSIPPVLYCEVPELVFLLWFEIIPPTLLLKDDELFRRCAEYGLVLLREPLLNHFSPIDCNFDEMIAIPHIASLALYRAVPVLLGAAHHLTAHYRKIVLDVSTELHVIHPYLYAT
ncbi:hypothetical protein, conserved [Trypanosoma brucei gambiense DAL972]|uniref:Uncharacterized protein n=1 Tax=Trypanosoma brucei gambiense (strain MHOM/CI/86/DAL972) TaxID=679716 RepID=C9ZNR6_TRYB9|nr:hypothetical protein, conserved [Trypanosoma brucei gambiense DAL972]CBH11044.1 hypothetical protein, conserved [Trypanosoma brucei gambiense DAL972]|eukprot:XP_011773331.1 hypothetical protein, conserved [Trypanosoma brucei gambiense DAL972]